MIFIKNAWKMYKNIEKYKKRLYFSNFDGAVHFSIVRNWADSLNKFYFRRSHARQWHHHKSRIDEDKFKYENAVNSCTQKARKKNNESSYLRLSRLSFHPIRLSRSASLLLSFSRSASISLYLRANNIGQYLHTYLRRFINCRKIRSNSHIWFSTCSAHSDLFALEICSKRVRQISVFPSSEIGFYGLFLFTQSGEDKIIISGKMTWKLIKQWDVEKKSVWKSRQTWKVEEVSVYN